MLIHQYDLKTGQYLNSYLADPDPMRPGRWLEPSGTTSTALPERPFKTWPFFVAGAWELRPDYRTLMLYRVEDGSAAEIFIPGLTPEQCGLTELPRPSDEHCWNAEARAWVVDPEIVAKHARAAAMADFDQRLALARSKNAGKADAYAAELLNSVEVALFKAWSAYQIGLVRAIESPEFPIAHEWPDEPDEVAIRDQVLAEISGEDAGTAETGPGEHGA